MAAAEDLPANLAAELLDAAREAFTQGLQVAALVSAVIAAVAAIMTAVFLRDIRAESVDESSGGAPVPATAAVEVE